MFTLQWSTKDKRKSHEWRHKDMVEIWLASPVMSSCLHLYFVPLFLDFTCQVICVLSYSLHLLHSPVFSALYLWLFGPLFIGIISWNGGLCFSWTLGCLCYFVFTSLLSKILKGLLLSDFSPLELKVTHTIIKSKRCIKPVYEFKFWGYITYDIKKNV